MLRLLYSSLYLRYLRPLSKQGVDGEWGGGPGVQYLRLELAFTRSLLAIFSLFVLPLYFVSESLVKWLRADSSLTLVDSVRAWILRFLGAGPWSLVLLSCICSEISAVSFYLVNLARLLVTYFLDRFIFELYLFLTFLGCSFGFSIVKLCFSCPSNSKL